MDETGNNFFQKFLDVVNTGNQSEINKRFIGQMIYEHTLDEIKFMIENGADPRYNNDEAFLRICTSRDLNIPLYFINDCNADVNVNNSIALEYAIEFGNINNVKLLLESGINITDEAIRKTGTARNANPVEIIRLLMDYVDHERVNNCVLAKISKNISKNDKKIIKYLIENGTDRDDILNKLLKN